MHGNFITTNIIKEQNQFLNVAEIAFCNAENERSNVPWA